MIIHSLGIPTHLCSNKTNNYLEIASFVLTKYRYSYSMIRNYSHEKYYGTGDGWSSLAEVTSLTRLAKRRSLKRERNELTTVRLYLLPSSSYHYYHYYCCYLHSF